MAKYKVSDLAKDFNVKNNIIIDLFKENDDNTKKSNSALSVEELDVAFELMTAKHSVANLDAYYAAKKPEVKEPEKKAPEKAETKENKPEAKKERNDRPEKPQTNDRNKPAGNKEQGRPEKKNDRPAQQTRNDQPGKPQQKNNNAGGNQSTLNPFKKKENKNKDNDFVQSRTKGDRKTVNTRAEEVDLDKYNEKYDRLSSNSMNERDADVRKQKIKQKSQQYNKKQGTRAHRKETEQERLARIAEERSKRTIVVTIGDDITVGELAAQLKLQANEVIKKLFAYGVMASINEKIDFDTAEIVATELGAKVEREVVVTIEDRIIDTREDDDSLLETRSPVVVVMGHVDHGKTSILDAIRNTSVTATESGGITQHIGAYRVSLDGNDITFLDTPGHAAFTEMRARGAKATDIAVLVVAADDGIMPQTIEAINHAKAADVSIIVAINKMDKPAAQPEKVMQQLTEYGLVAEEWGGDTICVPVSAKTHMNIDKLLESILLVAEMRELKANPNRAAKGVVIEARLDKGKGPIATLLVQNGTLNNGDIVVAGTSVGRIRVMTDYRGRRVKDAGPSVPVEVMGLAEVPKAGDMFDAVSDERLARELVEQRKQKLKDEQFNAYKKVTLDTLFSTLEAGELKDLNIIVKADVQGSVEALKQNLEKLSNNEVRVNVIHGGVGAITESDVMLANASNAIIVGFHVRPDATATAHAERDHVEMRMYSIIYDCIEDVQAAIKGMLAPKFRDVELGRAEVRRVFKLSSAGTIAGSYILNGKVSRNCKIRVVRDGIVIAEDSIASLKREKDDAKEVMSGYECGIGLEKYNDLKEGDIFEAYIVEEYRD